MTKLYTFTIPEDVPPGRLYPWLKRMLPELPESALRAAFERRDVKLNGRRIDRQAMLLPGGEVKLYTPEEAPRQPLVPILYQDERLLVVRKPAGTSCQPDERGGATVPQLVLRQLRESDPEAREPLLCHRLDNPTEGLLLLCRDEEAQAAMERAFRERRIQKRYLCLVKGTPEPRRALVKSFLRRDEKLGRMRVYDQPVPGGLTSLTEYAVLEPGPCARVEIWLHTGRTHQIRAQMAALGNPLLGDDLYGDRAFNRERKAKRLALCAVELRFSLEGPWAYLNGLRLETVPGF